MQDIEQKKQKMLEEKLKRLEEIRGVDKQKQKLQKSSVLKGKLPKTAVDVMRIQDEKRKLEKAKKKLQVTSLART